ncbi:ATPase [Alphaproteobacteria bacterium]|nr:ATPase [Alphaproteobacteria bacterium]
MIIKRREYLERLWRLKDKNLIKVITGVRRAGKSTLLQLFQGELLENGVEQEQIIDINFEMRENDDLTDWKKLHDEITSKMIEGKTAYIFLDEIQMVDKFERVVDSLYARKNTDIYITGSNAFLLSGELATLLSARYITTNVLPLSFSEYAQNFPDENKDRLFERFMVGSAMPETLDLGIDSPNLIDDYLREVYKTVVKKDIKNRFEIRDTGSFNRVVNFLFDSIGNTVSSKSIADALNAGNRNSKQNISHKTVANYLEYLTNSYLFYKVDRYDIKGKKLLKTQDKYYAVDLGFRQALLGQKPDIDLGHKLENLVFLELRRRNNGDILIGKKDENEVDFVVQNSAGNRAYYQVALTTKDKNTLERELKPLQSIRDNYQKFIISTDFDNSVYDGVRKVNVVDWLLGKE